MPSEPCCAGGRGIKRNVARGCGGPQEAAGGRGETEEAAGICAPGGSGATGRGVGKRGRRDKRCRKSAGAACAGRRGGSSHKRPKAAQREKRASKPLDSPRAARRACVPREPPTRLASGVCATRRFQRTQRPPAPTTDAAVPPSLTAPTAWRQTSNGKRRR